MLGVHGGWAARIFIHVTPTVTQDTAYKIHYREMWFSPPVVKHFSKESVTICFNYMYVCRDQDSNKPMLFMKDKRVINLF